MCGIAGLLDLDARGAIDPDLLARMNACLVHRGPDEEGAWTDGRVGLAMRRLSIIDLSTGRQPIANEDGSVRIVFNGEIYRYQSLREELLAAGHSFTTRSDTEVIVHLYEEMGVDCVTRLRGMFAFALWDATRGRLLLARDRIGKKPLAWAVTGSRLAWASELRALLQDPSIPRALDPVALDLYLGLQYVPSPRTIYRHVRMLPPGHRLIAEDGEIRVERWWEPPREEPLLDMTVPEAEQAVRDKVLEATRLRMVAERPVGAFLSGGIDSSIVVACMAMQSPRPVKTFSIGFEEESYSELPHAREVARRWGTEHEELVVSADMSHVLPLVAAQHGQPFGDPSALPTWHLCAQTKRHVTVALNGDGGDETFAGYRRYAGMRLAAALDVLPPGTARAGAAALDLLPVATRSLIGRGRRWLRAMATTSQERRYLSMIGCVPPALRDELYAPGFRAALGDDAEADVRFLAELFERGEDLDLVRRVQLVDLESYLPDCLMPKVDIASMAHSLEARSPLLDHEVIELAFRLPPSYKLRGLRGTKWILKRAFRDELPPSIVRRGKMGFGIPLAEWFRGPLGRTWEETCLSQAALSRGAFREEALRRLIADHRSGAADHGVRLWALLMLELWFSQCLPSGRVA